MANPTGINQYTKIGGNRAAVRKAQSSIIKTNTRKQSVSDFATAKRIQSNLSPRQARGSRILQTMGTSKRAASFTVTHRPYKSVMKYK